MPNKNPILSKLDKLAIKIAEEALLDATHLHDRMEAFKHLTNFYVNTSKVKSAEDDKPKEGTFDGYRDRIKQAETGDAPAGNFIGTTVSKTLR